MLEAYWEESAIGGLTFFGKMSACISHDIKNYLAIINEKAGLLDDLLVMAEQGRPLDRQIVKNTARDIIQQVRCADRVVIGLNRLAHSVDKQCCLVNLNETVGLIVSLSQRLAAAKKVCLELSLPTSVVQVESRPFFLMYVLFYYIDGAMNAPNDGRVNVDVKNTPDAGEITISGSFKTVAHPSESLPGCTDIFEEKLGITVHVESDIDQLVMRMSKAFRLKDG